MVNSNFLLLAVTKAGIQFRSNEELRPRNFIE